MSSDRDDRVDNIAYQTEELARYFAQNRRSWDQFYPSEQAVISQLALGPGKTVLDVGCGCGGLGLALRDEFGLTDYVGAEINSQAAELAGQMNARAIIHHGDILALSQQELRGKEFDVVFSLSCVDWNVRFADMIAVAWKHVSPGGWFVATFRLTTRAGCNDMTRSYQFINFEGRREGELAPYVVLNAADFGWQIRAFKPSDVVANGYWRAPSPTAVTPYEELCFAAVALRKRVPGQTDPTCYRLDVPAEIGQMAELLIR